MIVLNEIQAHIINLKKEKNALILAHFYQPMEIQETADIIGDSFELARRAQAAANPLLIVCGVKFMAESAKLLNPGKTVLIPSLDAGCPMADMITAQDVIALREKHPGAAVVCYVNSSVEVKAESDICCTSSSAEKIVRTLPNKEIIFIPDRNLGSYIASLVPEKKFIFFDGYCPIHDRLTTGMVSSAKKLNPRASLLVHPECPKDVRDTADFIGSTAQILNYVAENVGPFIIGTEIGIVERMKRLYPEKSIHLLDECLLCPDMKKISLPDLLSSLRENRHEIILSDSQISRAKQSLEKMSAAG